MSSYKLTTKDFILSLDKNRTIIVPMGTKVHQNKEGEYTETIFGSWKFEDHHLQSPEA